MFVGVSGYNGWAPSPKRMEVSNLKLLIELCSVLKRAYLKFFPFTF